jgi:hypothetical protein
MGAKEVLSPFDLISRNAELPRPAADDFRTYVGLRVRIERFRTCTLRRRIARAEQLRFTDGGRAGGKRTAGGDEGELAEGLA